MKLNLIKPDLYFSIACVNMTGLEKLKSQVGDVEFISLLNHLTVTFEAICEVRILVLLLLK